MTSLSSTFWGYTWRTNRAGCCGLEMGTVTECHWILACCSRYHCCVYSAQVVNRVKWMVKRFFILPASNKSVTQSNRWKYRDLKPGSAEHEAICSRRLRATRQHGASAAGASGDITTELPVVPSLERVGVSAHCGSYIRVSAWWLNFLSGHYMYRQFNIQQFYVPPTQCIYVFCVDLRTNSDYFPIQH
jgi:hypothetical protein